MDIRNKLRILGTARVIHIGSATILLGLALLLSIGFYYIILEYKLSERRFEVTSVAVHTNSDLIRLYRDAIRQTNLANESYEEKVFTLNAIIQPLFKELSNKYPNYEIFFESRVRDPSNLELTENYTSFGGNQKENISVTVPFNLDNIISGQVWITKTDDIYQSVLGYTIGFLGLLLVLFFIHYMLIWFMIRKLRKQLRSLSKSILENDGESKRIETEMKRLDGLIIIGQMAASIAHEVRNPMTTVRGFLQMLGAKPYFRDYKDYFELMIEELDRANSIITEFLSLSRNKPVALSGQSLNNIITKLLPLLQADAFRNEHNIIVNLEETPDIEMNEQEIRQVILNLARNGFESMSTGGVLMINVYLEKDQVVMTFKDQGSGISPEVLENIGKPFLTTKDKGTGLGLTVSYKIVYCHAGSISIETGTEGTTFKVKFPISHARCLG